MINQVEFEFPTQPQAYRFLNTARHLDAYKLKVKFGRSSYHVKVEYQLASTGFDNMLATLDDLAEKHEGKEVT